MLLYAFSCPSSRKMKDDMWRGWQVKWLPPVERLAASRSILLSFVLLFLEPLSSQNGPSWGPENTEREKQTNTKNNRWEGLISIGFRWPFNRSRCNENDLGHHSWCCLWWFWQMQQWHLIFLPFFFFFSSWRALKAEKGKALKRWIQTSLFDTFYKCTDTVRPLFMWHLYHFEWQI